MKKIKPIQGKRPTSKPFSKITTFLLFLFILFLPTQLGKHFFLPFSYLSGVRVDYLAPTIYLTDIIAFLILIFNLQTVGKFLTQRKVLLILGLLLINIFFSLNQPIAIYRYIKIIEWLALFAVFSQPLLKERLLLIGFSVAAVVELILATLQLANKHAIQGFFYFLGERYFNLSTPGIARASLSGMEILRPYATFSHPNSLAGFYLLVYFFVLTSRRLGKYLVLKNIFLFLSSSLVFLSFSKVAILSYFILNACYFLFTIKKCRLCLLSRVSIMTVLTLIFLNAKADPLTIDKRLELVRNAIEIILKQPVFGVGLGNYLLAQAQFSSKYLYFFNQPVHNVFLLFLAEVGIPLAFYILYQLFVVIKKLPFTIDYLLLTILITGLFDHYWLTLQQNFLLMGVLFGLKFF